MYINFEENGNTLIAFLSGELDHHSAIEIRTKIDDRLERNNIKNLIMNFSKVSFMDSSGIGVVIGRYKKLERIGGVVAITNLNDSVKRVFDLTGLFKIIKLYTSIDDALANI